MARLFSGFVREAASEPRVVRHRAVRARPARGAVPAAPEPAARFAPPAALAVGRSLHVGLDAVDPEHYDGWDGALQACEFDARDMAELARDAGFDVRGPVLTREATREAVVAGIRDAARALKAGDLFLFTISCHGGQLPDFNGDEEDGTDETLCLWDAQLIDDELWALWSQFAPGVRILVLSDSCHSGTVVKAGRHAALPAERRDALGTPRAMPRLTASKVLRRNRGYYRELAREIPARASDAATRTMARPVGASVRLISGCQDHQFSYDGVGNGQFTGALLEAHGGAGFRGDYASFHRAIVERMPFEQTPNHILRGAANPAYDAQRPFDI